MNTKLFKTQSGQSKIEYMMVVALVSVTVPWGLYYVSKHLPGITAAGTSESVQNSGKEELWTFVNKKVEERNSPVVGNDDNDVNNDAGDDDDDSLDSVDSPEDQDVGVVENDDQSDDDDDGSPLATNDGDDDDDNSTGDDDNSNNNTSSSGDDDDNSNNNTSSGDDDDNSSTSSDDDDNSSDQSSSGEDSSGDDDDDNSSTGSDDDDNSSDQSSSGEDSSGDDDDDNSSTSSDDDNTSSGGNGSSSGTSSASSQPFSVSDEGSLTLTEQASPTLQILGSAITYGRNGPEVPVKLVANIGGTEYTIFHGTGSEVTEESAQAFENLPAGTEINFTGTSYNPYRPNRKLYTQSTSSASEMIIPLRNGDLVPEKTPFGQQPTIESFLTDVIDPTTGKVTIADNEVLYLMELGTSNVQSSAADFQDLVFLAKF